MSTQLPLSAGFAVWFSAWVAGAVSLDDARDAIVGDDAAHHVAGLPGEEAAVPLILALGRLRSAGTTGAGIALPVPGDPLGLAGPNAFNDDALEDDGGAISAHEADRRRAALAPLDHAARRGLVAACSFPWDR